jgi:hypothetical protein
MNEKRTKGVGGLKIERKNAIIVRLKHSTSRT